MVWATSFSHLNITNCTQYNKKKELLPNSWLESKFLSQQIRFRTFSSLNLQTVLNLLYFYIKQKMILPNIKNRFLDPCKYIDELFRKRICVQILNMKVEYLSCVETLVFCCCLCIRNEKLVKCLMLFIQTLMCKC